VLGGEVVEAGQLIEVVADLVGGRVRPTGPVTQKRRSAPS
jgi:hypothetical protein